MKKLFNKRMVLNLLAMLVVTATTTPPPIGPGATGGCSWLFYEPKKPELLGKVTKEELLGIKK